MMIWTIFGLGMLLGYLIGGMAIGALVLIVALRNERKDAERRHGSRYVRHY